MFMVHQRETYKQTSQERICEIDVRMSQEDVEREFAVEAD